MPRRGVDIKETLQIMPAVGWRAAYADSNGTLLTIPLICWALVRETEYTDPGPPHGDVLDVHTYVTGMTADGDGIVEATIDESNFLGYLEPGGNLDLETHYAERARDRHAPAVGRAEAADARP